MVIIFFLFSREAYLNRKEEPPLGQRILDNPWLLLGAGLLVMFGFYTIWGLYEILTLPVAELP